MKNKKSCDFKKETTNTFLIFKVEYDVTENGEGKMLYFPTYDDAFEFYWGLVEKNKSAELWKVEYYQKETDKGYENLKGIQYLLLSKYF